MVHQMNLKELLTILVEISIVVKIFLLGIHKFYPDQRIQKQSISETLSRIKNTYG